MVVSTCHCLLLLSQLLRAKVVLDSPGMLPLIQVTPILW